MNNTRIQTIPIRDQQLRYGDKNCFSRILITEVSNLTVEHFDKWGISTKKVLIN
jgi:hypothetical protein